MCIKKSLIDKFGAALFFMGVRVELNSRLIHCWESRTRLIIQPNFLPNYTNADLFDPFCVSIISYSKQ